MQTADSTQNHSDILSLQGIITRHVSLSGILVQTVGETTNNILEPSLGQLLAIVDNDSRRFHAVIAFLSGIHGTSPYSDIYYLPPFNPNQRNPTFLHGSFWNEYFPGVIDKQYGGNVCASMDEEIPRSINKLQSADDATSQAIREKQKQVLQDTIRILLRLPTIPVEIPPGFKYYQHDTSMLLFEVATILSESERSILDRAILDALLQRFLSDEGIKGDLFLKFLYRYISESKKNPYDESILIDIFQKSINQTPEKDRYQLMKNNIVLTLDTILATKMPYPSLVGFILTQLSTQKDYYANDTNMVGWFDGWIAYFSQCSSSNGNPTSEP